MSCKTKFVRQGLLQVSGQLQGITGQLEEQHRDTRQILDVVNDLRYIAGVEAIEALFIAVMKGLIYAFTFILKKGIPEDFSAVSVALMMDPAQI